MIGRRTVFEVIRAAALLFPAAAGMRYCDGGASLSDPPPLFIQWFFIGGFGLICGGLSLGALLIVREWWNELMAPALKADANEKIRSGVRNLSAGQLSEPKEKP